MTTPAHCPRTAPHPPHEDRSDLDIRMPTRCPGVEPPADVQATPDPRLDETSRYATVRNILHERYGSSPRHNDTTLAILDALDDLAGAQTTHEPDPGQDAAIYREGWQAGYRSGTGDLDDMRDQRDRARGTLVADRYQAMIAPDPRPVRPSTPPPTPPPSGGTPAPAGLSAAQEIRLRLAEAVLKSGGWPDEVDMRATLTRTAAWVEHGEEVTGWPPLVRAAKRIDRLQGELDDLRARLGDDETPDPDAPTVADLIEGAGEANAAAARAEARADLAEARLGQVLGVLHRLDDNGKVETTEFYTALAWTPDDTAPVLPYVTEAIDAAAELAAMSQPHTAPAGAATGDGSTLPRVLEYRTKEAPDGDA